MIDLNNEMLTSERETDELGRRRGSRGRRVEPGLGQRGRPRATGQRTRPGRRRPPGRVWGRPLGKPHWRGCSCTRCRAAAREYARWVQTRLNDRLNLRLPVDGVIRPATRSAIRDFQRREGLPVDGIVGPATERALAVAQDGGADTAPPAARAGAGGNGVEPAEEGEEQFVGDLWDRISSGVGSAVGALTGSLRIIDRTRLTPKEKRKGKPRDIKNVYALVLHQMAFSRGSDPTKYDRVTAHFAILPDGKILQLHPVEALLWASNGFNTGSVAVEFAGNFPSTRGKCWSAQKFGCHKLTQAQIEAGRFLIQHLIRTIGLTHVLAHRQSSGTRENDPGPDIWYHVGQWAVDNLGLKDGGPGFKVGSGKPIPPQWRTWGQSKTTPELEQTSAPEVIDPRSPEHTRWLQRSLNQALDLRLPVDGRMRPPVRSALRSFQQRHGMAEDGELSDELEELLVAAGATPHQHPTGTTASAQPAQHLQSEQFIGDLWNWITGDASATITYNVVPGQEYGPKHKSQRPGGLPDWARQTSTRDAAVPHIERLAEAEGLGAVFVKATVQMARTESGARFALPANTFDARPPAQRPPGKPLITAWGVFQFNRDAWTSLVPKDQRRSRRSWIGKGTAGCATSSGCVFPWDCTAHEEIALPIQRYAELYREVQAAGGSATDAARGLRLWHISPAAYRSWLRTAQDKGFSTAWQRVKENLRQRITNFLTSAGIA